ncbi:hypothetical protein WKK05_16120 [Nostoc sp. UHCC 0302]|uniref:hypothetical protein n=1 Tax=Nostoc sp. UHCC 0302 TaxID=3134896 RepID=UPI00311CBFF6
MRNWRTQQHPSGSAGQRHLQWLLNTPKCAVIANDQGKMLAGDSYDVIINQWNWKLGQCLITNRLD